MTEEVPVSTSMRAWLKQRQQAAGLGTKNSLIQAHAMALMWLETQNIRPETVEDALKITDRYLLALRECVEVLGGSDLEITATFPDGKAKIEVLSQ